MRPGGRPEAAAGNGVVCESSENAPRTGAYVFAGWRPSVLLTCGAQSLFARLARAGHSVYLLNTQVCMISGLSQPSIERRELTLPCCCCCFCCCCWWWWCACLCTPHAALQYRMHPAIAKFPNAYFYDGALCDAPHMLAIRTAEFHALPEFGPFVAYDVGVSNEARGGASSYENVAEAKVVMRLLCGLSRWRSVAVSGHERRSDRARARCTHCESNRGRTRNLRGPLVSSRHTVGRWSVSSTVAVLAVVYSPLVLICCGRRLIEEQRATIALEFEPEVATVDGFQVRACAAVTLLR
jgi:AAA domain